VRGLGPAALAAALLASAAAVVLAWRRREAAARGAVAVAVGALTVATLALAVALVTVDGSLVYVADHTSRATPWPYRLSGLWGGMAGSLLLWTWMAAVWAVVGGVVVRRRAPALAGGVTLVTGSYLLVFCGLLVVVSRPFDRLAVPAVDGGGLNPVLLHPAMLYHPPLLYAGAVGLLVPFALALAGRRDDRAWLAPAARFATVSLVLLSAGLLAGAHWAYVELGWGGYWAWDPVENGGLLPWLAGVAFVHAAAVGRRRQAAGLAVLAFVLGMLGSFLTRSGASDSVHAFAEARAVGWVLGAGVLAAAVTTVAVLVRRPLAPSRSNPVIAANNALLVGLALVIGFGSLYPVVAGWLGADGLIVTGRYFTLVVAPLAVAGLLLLGVGPQLAESRRRLGPAAAGLAGAALAGIWFAERRPLAVLMVGMATAAAALTVAGWRRRPRARWPLAHLGIAVLLAGVAGTTTGTQVTAPLSVGGEVTVRGLTVRLDDVVPAEAPDGGRAARAVLTLRRDGDTLAVLRPIALVSDRGQRVSVAALRSTPVQDVQVALRAVGDGGEAVILEIGVHPLMQLVWWGGLVVVAGLAWGLAGPRDTPSRSSVPATISATNSPNRAADHPRRTARSS
jgi:cytochrome c-type biogenesis protein CcmF